MPHLRTPTLADAPALADAVLESVDDLRPWMEWAHPSYSSEEAHTWLTRAITDHGNGSAHEFLFTDDDGKLLGVCGLNRIHTSDRIANLGYWIRSSETGRGLAGLAVQQLVQWGFEKTRLGRLEIVVAVENVRSQRVAEKAGAHRVGILRSRIWLYEVPRDAVIYSITRPHPPEPERKS